jgi:hypothetical protein
VEAVALAIAKAMSTISAAFKSPQMPVSQEHSGEYRKRRAANPVGDYWTPK